MTLLMLQYFLAIAKTGNFTRAAEECYVTQPTLSRAIRELEEELGCELLRRTSRSVELTEAGEVCARKAKRVISDVRRLEEKVRSAAQVRDMPLTAGYIIYDHLMYFLRLVANPDDGRLPVRLDPQYITTAEAVSRVLSGDLDFAILPEPSVVDVQEAEVIRIARGKAYAIVPLDCPLAARESIRLSQLVDYPVIEWDEADVPKLHDAYARMFLQAGIRPNVVDKARKMGDMLTKIMTHTAIGFGTTAAAGRSSDSVRYVEIEDSPEQFGIVCIFHRGAGGREMERLRELLPAL